MSTQDLKQSTPGPDGEAALADLLPDLLNGHLEDTQRVELEAALKVNPQLREQLDFERELQSALRTESVQLDQMVAATASTRGSGFEAIASRIVDSPVDRLLARLQGFWTSAGLQTAAPAFAMLLVVGVLAGSNLPTSEMQINEFETYISAEQHDQPTLRILSNMDVSSPEFTQLLSEHDLQLVSFLQDSNTADVVLLSEDADIERIAIALSTDERIAFAKILDK